MTTFYQRPYDYDDAVDTLRQDYLFARRRFRTFMQKLPRRHRRVFRKGSGKARKSFARNGFNKGFRGKGMGFGKGNFTYTSDPSYFQQMYIGKGGKFRRNPRTRTRVKS